MIYGVVLRLHNIWRIVGNAVIKERRTEGIKSYVKDLLETLMDNGSFIQVLRVVLLFSFLTMRLTKW